jgi:methionyl-tRNA synthetase
MALNLPLPDKFLVHGWIIMKEGKMSKSKGNVVYPEPIKEMYGMDLLRYYLLREIPFCEDGIFTPEQFVERCNADLANNYGNLTHRSLSMIKKYFNGVIPAYKGHVNEFDAGLEASLKLSTDMFFEKMDNFDVTNAVSCVFEAIDKANKYIDDCKPWALAKDESKKEELESVMNHLANVIYRVSVLLSPFLTEGTTKILNMLNCPEELRSYDALEKPFGQLENISIAETLTPAYARLDATVEIERMKENIYTRK